MIEPTTPPISSLLARRDVTRADQQVDPHDHIDPVGVIHPRAGRRFKVSAALASATGLTLWLLITLLTGKLLTQPATSGIASLFARWNVPGVVTAMAPQIGGPMQQSATAARGALTCDSSGESAVGADLIVPQNQTVCGDVLVVGGRQQTLGEVRGSIQVIGGDAVIAGVVTGNVTVIGGNIQVESSGHISGAAHALGGTVSVSPYASVGSVGADIQMPRDMGRPPGFNFSIDVGSFWLSLMFWISASLGLTALAPEAIGHVRFTVSHHFARSALAGFIIALVAGLLSVALIFTCLGIPVAVAIGVAGWLAWVVGTVGVGAWLGEVVFGSPHRSRPPSLLTSAVLGVVILSLLKATPIVGPVIGMLVGMVALGAATLTLLSARRATYARLR